jgi:hypothetical protein
LVAPWEAVGNVQPIQHYPDPRSDAPALPGQAVPPTRVYSGGKMSPQLS